MAQTPFWLEIKTEYIDANLDKVILTTVKLFLKTLSGLVEYAKEYFENALKELK